MINQKLYCAGCGKHREIICEEHDTDELKYCFICRRKLISDKPIVKPIVPVIKKIKEKKKKIKKEKKVKKEEVKKEEKNIEDIEYDDDNDELWGDELD